MKKTDETKKVKNTEALKVVVYDILTKQEEIGEKIKLLQEEFTALENKKLVVVDKIKGKK